MIKQLKIAHDRKSSLSQQRKNSESQEKKYKSSISIFASFFEDITDSKSDHIEEEDDDIPDFYHLPRISIQELHQMFKDGRSKYEVLKKIYITDKQQVTYNMPYTPFPKEYSSGKSHGTRIRFDWIRVSEK